MYIQNIEKKYEIITKKRAHAVVYTIKYSVSVHDRNLWMYKYPRNFFPVFQ